MNIHNWRRILQYALPIGFLGSAAWEAKRCKNLYSLNYLGVYLNCNYYLYPISATAGSRFGYSEPNQRRWARHHGHCAGKTQSPIAIHSAKVNTTDGLNKFSMEALQNLEFASNIVNLFSSYE